MAVRNDIQLFKGEAVTLYFGMGPATFTTEALAANATVMHVGSTLGFAASGTAYILVGAVVSPVTYTGLTPTSFTGCAGVPAAPVFGALVTSGATNIGGWTVTLTVKATATDAAAVLTVTPATIVSAAGGIFSLALTSAQTKTTLGVGVFAYDVQRVDAGSEAVLSHGVLTVRQEVLY